MDGHTIQERITITGYGAPTLTRRCTCGLDLPWDSWRQTHAAHLDTLTPATTNPQVA